MPNIGLRISSWSGFDDFSLFAFFIFFHLQIAQLKNVGIYFHLWSPGLFFSVGRLWPAHFPLSRRRPFASTGKFLSPKCAKFARACSAPPMEHAEEILCTHIIARNLTWRNAVWEERVSRKAALSTQISCTVKIFSRLLYAWDFTRLRTTFATCSTGGGS